MSKLIYRGYNQAALDAQYNNQRSVPATDYPALMKRYSDETALAKQTSHCLEDLRYGPHPDQLLDLYLPQATEAPIQVFIHGGAWRQLGKNDSGFAASAFTQARSLFAALHFSASPAVTLDTMVRQVREAIAWLWRHAQCYGGDPTRIFVSGHSSGSHLLSQCLVADWPGEFGCPADVIKGATFVSGLGDLEPVRLSYRNEGLKLDEHAVQRLSLMRQTATVRCPLIAAYAELDTDEFRRQTSEVAGYWERCGFPTQLLELKARNHFDGAFELANPAAPLFRACATQMGLLVSP